MSDRRTFSGVKSMHEPPRAILSRGNPMGEAKKWALKVRFERRLRLEFHGTRMTSDAGLLACREGSSTGRYAAFSLSSSKWAAGSCGTPATSPSSWPRSVYPGRHLPLSWRESSDDARCLSSDPKRSPHKGKMTKTPNLVVKPVYTPALTWFSNGGYRSDQGFRRPKWC